MKIIKPVHNMLCKWRKIIFIYLALFLGFVGFAGAPAVHAQFVHTDGTRIVDGNGNNLYFNGMNLGNWLLWEGYLMMGDFNYRTHTQFLNSLASAFGDNMIQAKEFEHQWRLNYVTEQTIIDLKNLGFNSVRVPFHYNMFWQNGQLSNHGFQYFDRLIQWCKAHGVYILLDMHAAPGYQNPGDHSDNMNSNASQPRNSVGFWDGNNVQIASQVWRHIASRYADEPIIWGYDLINEPVLPAGREYELLPSLIQMRNAIREVDNNHIIVAEGGWWGSQMEVLDWTNPQTRAATGVTSKWDHNLVYQTHHYVFGNAGAIQDLNGRTAITNNLGVPMILGEYGEDTNNIIRQMTDWSINNIAGHFPWSFKKMSHDRTLWTIQPNNAYNQVKNAINSGSTAPAGSYQAMITFAQNNIANGRPGITWHQGFYDAAKGTATPPLPPPPAGCANVTAQNIASAIQAESYCAMNGIQTETTTDTGGGLNVGWIDVGDWMDYRVNVPAAGTYTLTYRIASTANTGEIQFLNNGATLASTSLPNTGGWQQWQSVTAAVSLPGGAQTIRLHAAGAGFNLNWIQLSSSGSSSSSSSTGGFSGNGTYRIVNVNSVKALDVAGVSTSNGANIRQWAYGGGNNQRWQVASVGSGVYSITSVHSGKALDVSGVSTSNGANIHQWDYVGGNNQHWQIVSVGNGRYRITSVHSGKSLDVQNASTGDGGNVHQWDYLGGANQQWTFSAP